MRLTSSLQKHGLYFWWGKGWGRNPHKDQNHRLWKWQWEKNQVRPLEVMDQVLPKDVTPIDPNVYVHEEFRKELNRGKLDFVFPWPYSPRPIKGTAEDPDYREQLALVYRKNKRIVEPINLPLYFSNSVLEDGLPQKVQQIRNNVKIDDNFSAAIESSFKWCLFDDSTMEKLPLNRDPRYPDQKPPIMYGVPVFKKEENILQSLYFKTSEWMAKQYGYNTQVLMQKVSSPHCLLPINRDGKFVIFDLQCDFISILTPKSGTQLKSACFDTSFNTNTSHRSLTPIYPISWQVGFHDTHFYDTDFEFRLPQNSSVQGIFISSNSSLAGTSNLKNRANWNLKDEDYKGQSIMSCYVFAVQQAKLLYKTNEIDKIELEKPICVHSVYTSPGEYPGDNFKVGFVLFQLNTLKFNDETVRNQVWMSEPKSPITEAQELFADIATIQTLGFHNF